VPKGRGSGLGSCVDASPRLKMHTSEWGSGHNSALNQIDVYQLTRRSGDGARAHELSQQGKNHQKRQDELDDEAAGWIFNGASHDIVGTRVVGVLGWRSQTLSRSETMPRRLC
jgi:hypothetical protein